MNNLDPQYINLVKDILVNGHSKEDRTGTGTKSVFSRQIRHKMSDGFPLLTTKKMPFKTIVTELLWFLRGDTNIKFLVDNDCNIWNGDAYKNYLKKAPKERINDILKGWYERHLTEDEFVFFIKKDEDFAKKWGDLGPIYGKQWRNWTKFEDESKEHNEWYISSEPIDQIQNSINLLKTDPDSRRNIVSAWNVGEMKDMVLPPCHNFFQFYTRELNLDEREKYWRNNMGMKDIQFMLFSIDGEEGLHKEYDKQNVPRRTISLIWNQRSVDTGLGLPFNIASYALLLEIIGKMVNMVPDELIGNLGDTHLYNNHIEPIQEQLGREGYILPKLEFSKPFGTDIKKYIDKENMDLDIFISRLKVDDFILKDYQSHPTIKLPLSN